MNHLKTFKSITKLKTQKTIKEEIQKQEFFEDVIKKMKVDLTKEEQEFFLICLNKKKYKNIEKTRYNFEPQKKTDETKESIHQKQFDFPFEKFQEDIFHAKKDNLLKTNLTEVSPQPLQSQNEDKLYIFSKNIKNKTSINQVLQSLTNSSFQNISIFNTTARSRGKDGDRKKFIKVYPSKLKKSLQKKQQQQIINNQKLIKVYRNNFIENIFERHTHNDHITKELSREKETATERQKDKAQEHLHKSINFSPKFWKTERYRKGKISYFSSIKIEELNKTKNRSVLKCYSRKF